VDKHTVAQDCRYRSDDLFVFSSLFSLSSPWKNTEDSLHLIFISNLILIFFIVICFAFDAY